MIYDYAFVKKPKASMEQREIFTRNFFDALEAGGAKKVSEVPESGLGGYGTILLALAQSESQTKIVIGKLISSFVGYLKNVDLKQALKSRQGIYGAGCMLLGMFFIIFPQGAVNSIGIIAAAIGILWSSRRIAALVFENEEPKTRKQRKLITYEAVMCLMAVMAGNSRIAMISVNFVLGAMLIGFAFSKIWKMMTMAKGNRIFQVWTITESVFALLLGVVTVVTTGQVSSSRMLTVGTFLILYGVGKIVLEMYANAKQKLEKA